MHAARGPTAGTPARRLAAAQGVSRAVAAAAARVNRDDAASRLRLEMQDAAPAPAMPRLARAALAAAAVTFAATPALASLHPEPANALSLPTWAIHVSSVAEWVIAMSLFRRLAAATAVPEWGGMAWGMLPALGSALCACTFHFFYNPQSLAPLVAVQAGLTLIGNCTLWYAAWRIYRATAPAEEVEGGEVEG